MATFVLTCWLVCSSRQTVAHQAQPIVKAPEPAPPTLPITQVVLFSSGVGYFQREGQIVGNARVELSFPATDINDLLKSLVLQDASGGHVQLISYDSHDPLEKSLRSFALDLTYNPTFGQLLNQARGEKVEVVLAPTREAAPGTLTGVIVGMESQRQEDGSEIDLLNILGLDGMRSLPLARVERVRFLNPALNADLGRALEALAQTHDSRKKTLALAFAGAGKRPVRVGYVVETPMWKTSYRLVLDRPGQVLLQGWAIVENSSDEDWKDVRLALVAGRPLSFQMDLFAPLYVPRPTVEPDVFASLRPPAYEGVIAGLSGNQGFAGGIGGVGGLGGGFGGGLAGNIGGSSGGGPSQPPDRGTGIDAGPRGNAGNMEKVPMPPANRYQLGGPLGSQGGIGQGLPNRLSYEDFQKRMIEASKEQPPMPLDPREGVRAASSGVPGENSFQYVIEERVSLPRQKSALLPIVNREVEAARVSIFNDCVHPKFPLLGLRFRNGTGLALAQGPITVYEGGRYAGDARLLDMQPHEERLVSYAVDLGVEVKAEEKSFPEKLVSVHIAKGIVHASMKLHQTKSFLVRNRSDRDRVLLIEHPVCADWKLIRPEKPAERTRQCYRFRVAVGAGRDGGLTVVEEKSRLDQVALSSADSPAIRLFLTSEAASSKVKEALQKALDLKAARESSQSHWAGLERQLREIQEDQGRLRANLSKVPPISAAYRRYLTKFDTQETEIERLQGEIKNTLETVRRQQDELEKYWKALNVD
jgi:hypothetical protein